MKFLYKIWSKYDGFTPGRFPQRLESPKNLALGWNRYVDSVEVGHEVWIYFHGPGVSPAGVYAKGFVKEIDSTNGRVNLRVREYSTERPLTDSETTELIAGVVSARGLQVFVYPEVWDTPAHCTVGLSADSCRKRLCDSCETWKRLTLIDGGSLKLPRRFPEGLEGYAPAYWVIPRRCYLHYEGQRIDEAVERSSELFYRFKSGESNLAYPLALGIYNALRKRRLLEFDCIVPIPLSPDKAAKGEIHRTRMLAEELAALLDAGVEEYLTLTESISKHRLRTEYGYTAARFEHKYYLALAVDQQVESCVRLLLIDDVSTEGSTLRSATRRIRDINPEVTIVGATAGQMILKHVVADEEAIAGR